MEQPCYKCGQSVEEGTPFCPHCSAPQIRVVVTDAVATPLISAAGAASTDSPALSSSHPLSATALPTHWADTLKPGALAALVAALLMVLGLNPFVAMISAGFLAVVFYRQRQPGAPITPRVGSRLGAVSGLLWFGLSVALQGTLVLLLHKGPELRDEALKRIQQTAPNTSDPQVQAWFEYFKTPAGLTVLLVLAVIFAFVAALILGVLGGALAGAVLSRREKG